MFKDSFRKLLKNDCRRVFVESSLPIVESETDPSFALTGMQMFVCAMNGTPLPTPPLLQEYNGLHADEITPCDAPFVDRLDGISMARKIVADADNNVVKLKNSIKDEA